LLDEELSVVIAALRVVLHRAENFECAAGLRDAMLDARLHLKLSAIFAASLTANRFFSIE
jgi:hypothetical protein